MTNKKIRMQCLKMARKMAGEYGTTSDVLRRAEELIAFVRNEPPAKSGGIVPFPGPGSA